MKLCVFVCVCSCVRVCVFVCACHDVCAERSLARICSSARPGRRGWGGRTWRAYLVNHCCHWIEIIRLLFSPRHHTHIAYVNYWRVGVLPSNCRLNKRRRSFEKISQDFFQHKKHFLKEHAWVTQRILWQRGEGGEDNACPWAPQSPMVFFPHCALTRAVSTGTGSKILKAKRKKREGNWTKCWDSTRISSLRPPKFPKNWRSVCMYDE